MSRRITGLLAGCLALLPPPVMAGDQTMGRLFFTPEQRGRMDVAREQERSVNFDLEEEESAPPPANLTLNGVITRSDGKTTVWINNRIQAGEKTGLDIAVPREKTAGQISVTTPDAKRPVQLKVGQSIDMSSGQVEEVYRRSPPVPEKDMPPTAGKADTAKSPAPRNRKDDMPADDQGEATPPR